MKFQPSSQKIISWPVAILDLLSFPFFFFFFDEIPQLTEHIWRFCFAVYHKTAETLYVTTYISSYFVSI